MNDHVLTWLCKNIFFVQSVHSVSIGQWALSMLYAVCMQKTTKFQLIYANIKKEACVFTNWCVIRNRSPFGLIGMCARARTEIQLIRSFALYVQLLSYGLLGLLCLCAICLMYSIWSWKCYSLIVSVWYRLIAERVGTTERERAYARKKARGRFLFAVAAAAKIDGYNCLIQREK